jgi:thymidylate synthase ThyX
MSDSNVVAAAQTDSSSSASTSADVYAVYGVEPEVLAYAMAKYSRSALSMKDSLRELNQQRAEKFLNTFYFQYGHRSIADLAHIALAVERLSILAAITVADEQRWDGQERSTRYQDFRKSGYYIPDFGNDQTASALYRDTIEGLFSAYEKLSETMFRYLAGTTPRPADMKQEAYDRTLRARAFDTARYLLPLATNTSLGEIVNARTLETQVAHLLSHTHKEVRDLGLLLKRAATEPAFNLRNESVQDLVAELRDHDPALAHRITEDFLKQVRVAPTLVKYADPNPYEIESRRDLRRAASELMKGVDVSPAEAVDLLDAEPLEVEIATTLLYEHCHYPYRQIRTRVEDAGPKMQRDIIDLGLRHRGKHDEVLRPFCAGQQLRFDILMDIGGFRDMHRHRRCIQIGQDFTIQHGFESPVELEGAGVLPTYEEKLWQTYKAVRELEQSSSPEAVQNAQYAIPLAFRKRTLFKMDFAEALYISELRTTPAGHSSYRKIAYAMYDAVAHRYPSLSQYFRVHDIHRPVDLLQR